MWQTTPTKPFWMQVYTLKDDDFMQRLFDRAKRCQMLGGDDHGRSAMLGQRHKDLKNGLSAPPKLTPSSVANMMTKVRGGWACWAPSGAASAISWAMPRA